MKLTKISCLVLLGIVVTFSSCQQELYRSNKKFNIPEKSSGAPLVQFLIEPTNYSAIAEVDNLSKAYDYSKIPYNTIWVNQFNERLSIAPSARVVTLYESTGLNDIAIDSLLKFVSKGGTLFISKAIKDDRMSYFYGMRPGADWSQNTQANGIHFNKPLFPGMQGFDYDNKIAHLGFDASNFSGNITTLVSAKNDMDYPVLIENKVGNGRVIFYNSSEVLQKEMRGILFAATLLGLEGIPYPVANVATIFLDEFSQPYFKENGSSIKNKSGELKSELVHKIVWPKLKALAKEENLKYSASVLFNAETKNTGDFNFNGWKKTNEKEKRNDTGNILWLATDFLKDGHQLGYTGYNKLPLTKSKWVRIDEMLESNNAAEKQWKVDISKETPISFMPVNNQIDSLGLVSLNKAFPSLTYIHSSFLGDITNGGDREFDPDPLNNRFFVYPKLSSGYYVSQKDRWIMESTFLYTGIWTHAVSADQLIESKDIEQDLSNFKITISDFKGRHPQLQFLNAKRATEHTMDWRYQGVKHLNFEGQYEVSSTINADVNKASYWMLYVNAENEKKLNSRFKDEQMNFESTPFLNGYMYNIKTGNPNISVPDMRPKIRNLKGTTNTIAKKTKTEYDAFNKGKTIITATEQKVERLIVEDKKEEATVLMEELFVDNKFINASQIVSYARFMKAQGKEAELWGQLEKIYKENPSKAYADFSRTVSKISGYPSSNLKKLWIERQLEWNSKDLELLKEYYTDYNTEENNANINQVLVALLLLEPTNQNRENYIEYLYQSNDAALLAKLDQIEPCSIDDDKLASTIANSYANNLNFDKAIQWVKCTDDIPNDKIVLWETQSLNFEQKKTTDYPYYIKFLLVNDQDRALRELIEIESCREDLNELSKDIALAYGEQAIFDKAIEWSKCSKNVPAKSIMEWYVEVGDIKSVYTEYYEHMSRNPGDYDMMNHMAKLLLLHGDLENAAKIALTIPPKELDSDFKIAFNNAVNAQPEDSQLRLVDAFKVLMDDDIIEKSKLEKRKKQGTSIGFASSAIADQFNPTFFNNSFNLGYYNKKGDFNKFSISQSTAYTILKDTIIPNDEARDLLGLSYKFEKTSKEQNPYWLGARIDLDNLSKIYAHFNAGMEFYKEGREYEPAGSFEIAANPVKTGPGYVLDIYSLSLKGKGVLQYGDKTKQTLMLEGNYYTDDQYYSMASTRLDYNLITINTFTLSTLLEGVYNLGSEERRNGFPYWLTEERLWGGGGLQLEFGNHKSPFHLRTEFSYFGEQDEPSFQRYTGELSFTVKNFTKIYLDYSYFTIDQFFNNSAQLGIQYNFR